MPSALSLNERLFHFPKSTKIEKYLGKHPALCSSPISFFLDEKVKKSVSLIFSKQRLDRYEINEKVATELIRQREVLKRPENSLAAIAAVLSSALIKCAEKYEKKNLAVQLHV